ncbi:cysteine hydrolase family protein [Cryobacterium ruanii]|uniref:Isochorismatase family protein n=1 Tax=Cryobacterium ruanii TaxID=1259197 RepID=A0A4R9ALX4_9MICO|nr:isochorismatase family protein [Cryobacterium ruanii]TFD63544.1 isochorismatase family protein [Cryobacterium ruanii]
MTNFEDKLNKWVDRTYRYIPDKIDLNRTVVHMLDVQNLCLDKRGADYVQSVGGAPSGEESLVQAKNVLDAAREKGIKVNWSMWGMDPNGYDIGLWGEKYPAWKSADSPFNHGTFDGALCDGFVPAQNEAVLRKHRNSSFFESPFNSWLKQDDCKYLVIAGSSTGNCVPTTARDGFELGYKVIVIADSGTAIPLNTHGRNPEFDHEVPEGYGQYWEGLRNMQAQYADVMSTREFLELIQNSSK